MQPLRSRHAGANRPLLENANVSNGGEASEWGWCQGRWGISWQITPRVLTEAVAASGEEAKRAFAAMMEMGKIG